VTAAEVFLDTAVLVAAVGTDPVLAANRDTARALVREDRFGSSAQVVEEFYRAVTEQADTPLSTQVAARWVDRLTRMPFVPTDAILVKSAIVRARAWAIPCRDALVVSAAEALGATTLYTPRLKDGQSFGPVVAINPFVEVAQQ